MSYSFVGTRSPAAEDFAGVDVGMGAIADEEVEFEVVDAVPRGWVDVSVGEEFNEVKEMPPEVEVSLSRVHVWLHHDSWVTYERSSASISGHASRQSVSVEVRWQRSLPM